MIRPEDTKDARPFSVPAEVERSLDAELGKPWAQRDRVYGRSIRADSFSPDAIQAICKAYRLAGWSVKHQTSPCGDDPMLVFHRPQDMEGCE